jgi:hypothetical protein
MLLPKSRPLWTSVSLFAVAVVMIPLAGQRLRPPVSSPGTLAELSACLSQCTPPLYVVPQLPNCPQSAMWVCTRPRSREQLVSRLNYVCDPERVERGQWEGIVLCQSSGEGAVMEDEFIAEHWGPYGMRIGRLVFFGDPDLLQRIRTAMTAAEPRP